MGLGPSGGEGAYLCGWRAHCAGSGGGAQVLGGSSGPAWARGTSISPEAAGFQPQEAGRGTLGSCLFSSKLRIPETPRRWRQQQAQRRRWWWRRRRQRRRRCLRAARVSSSRAGLARARLGEGRSRDLPIRSPGASGRQAAPPLATAPCDCASSVAGTGESHAANSCCTAGPQPPPSPPRFTPSCRSILGQPEAPALPGGGRGEGFWGTVPA